MGLMGGTAEYSLFVAFLLVIFGAAALYFAIAGSQLLYSFLLFLDSSSEHGILPSNLCPALLEQPLRAVSLRLRNENVDGFGICVY